LNPDIIAQAIPENPVTIQLPENPTSEQIALSEISTLEAFAQTSEKAAAIVRKEKQRREMIVKLNCGKALLVNEKGMVSLERFGKIVDMFGPLVLTLGYGRGLLENILLVMTKTWFHGDISKDEAYNQLMSKGPGAFLLRFSNRQNAFVISRVISKEGKNWVTHITVKHSSNGFSIPGSDTSYPDIIKLIKTNKHMFQKKTPIGHVNPLRWINSIAIKGPYEDDDDENGNIKLHW